MAVSWLYRLVMVTFTASDELRGAEFFGADLRDAWFRQTELDRRYYAVRDLDSPTARGS